jgi:capsular polysaccharide biosynthesis protein
VQAEKTLFCKPLTHTSKYWNRIVDFATRGISPVPKNIFLSRSKKTLRYLENQNEIDALLEKFGFINVDAATMPFQKQVQLFSGAETLVGIHGAGLTNMVFRGHKALNVIEIFPQQEYLPFHYIMLANMFGFKYTAIIGSTGHEKSNGGFYLRSDSLLAQLKTFFTSVSHV